MSSKIRLINVKSKNDLGIFEKIEKIFKSKSKINLITPEVRKIKLKPRKSYVDFRTSNSNFIKNEENILFNSMKKEDNKKEIVKTDTSINFNSYGLNLNIIISDEEQLLREDSPLICDYEKGQIIFTKKGFIELFEKLWSLEKYSNFYNKDNLTLDIIYEGSPLNSEYYLIRSIFKQPKSEYGANSDLKSLIDFIYKIDVRNIWDKAIKKVETYGGNEKNFIVCTWAHSPIIIMGERESIEKRFIFENKGAIYIMSTSIPEDYFPYKENVIRITNFVNFCKVVDEGENFCFYGINQSDFKMIIPQLLINITLPMTTLKWYKNLSEFISKVKFDKQTKKVKNVEDFE